MTRIARSLDCDWREVALDVEDLAERDLIDACVALEATTLFAAWAN